MNRFLIVLTVCIVFLFERSRSAVLGIDYGSDRIKVASVQPGRAFEIVLDEASKRAHPSLVVFDDDVRQYGTTGSSLVSRRPDKSFLYFTKLLGKPYNTSITNELEKDFVFTEITKDEKRGTIRFKSPYYNPNEESSIDDVITAQSYTVEEITSMKLKHIKKMADKYIDGDVTDCVMTVPQYWSMKERLALRDAAQLAGLNVYGLINENTAAAVQYGLKRDYSSNKTEYYLFYNMGSSSTQVSVVKYWAYDVKERSKTRTVGCVDVMSQTWDETLGGNSFDQIVSKLIIQQAKELLRKQTNPKIDESIIDNLQKDPKFTARIRTAANKAKKILSANNEASVNIEGVYADIDFRTIITRDEMYREAQENSLFERAVKPMNDAIEGLNGKIEKSDLEGIVLLGGSTRIPRIKELLTEYLDKELRQDLNADEAPAFGAAFRAANLSSTFRVLGVNMEDISPFPVGVRLSNLADLDSPPKDSSSDNSEDTTFAKRGSLFSENNNLYKRRAVTLKHNEDLFVSLFYEKYANLPTDTSTDLGSYKITGITSAVNKYKLPDYNITDSADDMPKVSLSFLLDADAIVDLVQATATFTEYITEERKIPKVSPSTDSKDSKDSSDTTSTTDDSNTSETGSDTDTTKTEKTESDSTTTDSEGKTDGTDGETELVTRKKTHRVELGVEKFLPNDIKSYDADDFDASVKVLMELDERDQTRLATAHARNELESYIFESRSKLYDDSNVEKVSTEEERESLISLLNEAEEWIWDVEEESEKIFNSKTKELRDVGDKIFFRAKELEARPKAVDMAGKAIHQLYEYVETLRVNYSWVNSTDIDRLEEMTKNAESWLNNKIEEQSEKSLKEEPVFQSTQVQRRMVPILEYANKLLSKQKPYDYYKKKDKKNKNGTKSSNDTDSNNTDDTSGTSGSSSSSNTDNSDSTNEDGTTNENNDDTYTMPINTDDDDETNENSGKEEEENEKKGEL